VAFLFAGVGSLDSPMKKATGFFLVVISVLHNDEETLMTANIYIYVFAMFSCIQKTNKSFPESFQEATFFVFFVGLTIFF